MKPLLIFLYSFFVIQGLAYSEKTDAELYAQYKWQAIIDLRKIVNYHELSQQDSIQFLEQRIEQLALQNDSAIPHRYRIPAELIAYRKSGDKQYYVKYNTSRSTYLGYVPSDLVSLYEYMAFKYARINKEMYPSISIVLAQQFTESLFNPALKGDGGKSIGLPQLHKPTARWLLDVDAQTWNRFFYFDKQNQHHFRNLASQVEFPFIFLPHFKKFTQSTKFDGLRRYNGSGSKARQYAQLIIARSMFYEEMLNQKSDEQIDTTLFKKQVKDLINMGLYNKEFDMLTDSELDGVFGEVQALYTQGMRIENYIQQVSRSNHENAPQTLNKMSQFEIPTGGESYFFIMEEGRSLFSYFMNIEEMLNTLNMPENKLIYVYYHENGNMVKVQSRNQMTGQAVYTNARAGDRIFLKPGTKIYSSDADIIIRVASN